MSFHEKFQSFTKFLQILAKSYQPNMNYFIAESAKLLPEFSASASKDSLVKDNLSSGAFTEKVN
jgi:hypothetical protein